jgi:catechol 2,3-dioxygenase-like lactoylglutathione lyase family enzyme
MSIAPFTLAVPDVVAASRLLPATLGWRPIDRPSNIPLPSAWLEVAPGEEVHLVQVADFAPSPFEQEFGRHVAVIYPRDDFAGLRERLRQHGAEPIAPAWATPFERIFFRDPNGYVFEVIEAERAPEV